MTINSLVFRLTGRRKPLPLQSLRKGTACNETARWLLGEKHRASRYSWFFRLKLAFGLQRELLYSNKKNKNLKRYERFVISKFSKSSLAKIKWNYNYFHRDAAKEICFLITAYSCMAENITIGGFTKIRIQTSINFILLWCAPGELSPFDTLQFD